MICIVIFRANGNTGIFIYTSILFLFLNSIYKILELLTILYIENTEVNNILLAHLLLNCKWKCKI